MPKSANLAAPALHSLHCTTHFHLQLGLFSVSSLELHEIFSLVVVGVVLICESADPLLGDHSGLGNLFPSPTPPPPSLAHRPPPPAGTDPARDSNSPPRQGRRRHRQIVASSPRSLPTLQTTPARLWLGHLGERGGRETIGELRHPGPLLCM